MNIKIDESWKIQLAAEFEKPYFQDLVSFVKEEYKNHTIFPSGKDIFKAFEYCSFADVKVVIVGQDPYHGHNQANGLSFSVNEGVSLPPSLQNIFKERETDLGKPIPSSGDLSAWAKQGVLLLNATLTVRAATPGSHQKKGWETFTDAVIKSVSERRKNVVFILWGAYAQQKGSVIDTKNHFVIQSPHPSPFSVYKGFYGSKPFSKANLYLASKGISEIDW